jgi:hypothetical protein
MTAEEYNQLIANTKKKNKYNAKRSVYKGISYDSTGEANYAATLDLRIKAGEIHHWERQVKIDIPINGKPWRSLRVDFKVYITPTVYEFHEYKGKSLPTFEMKWDAIRIQKDELFPNIKFVLIKIGSIEVF